MKAKTLFSSCLTLALLSLLGCNNNEDPSSFEILDISDLLATYDEGTSPYTDRTMWLSGPSAADDFILSVNLDTTVVNADLSTEVLHIVRPTHTDFDIFYIYPTVNLDSAPGNDDLSDLTNTKGFVTESIARFSTIGRVITPLYHSATAGCFFSQDKSVLNACLEFAYQDIEKAFIYYLANHWGGEKLAIMGFSQGAVLARMLLQRVMVNYPALMDRVVVVIPMSGDLNVNSFSSIPPCEQDEQTGCYITYHSFLAGAEPQAGTVIGDWSGVQAACTDVAGTAGKTGLLSNSYFSLPAVPGSLPSDALAGIPISIDTPFITFPEFYTAECVNTNGASYLRVEQANPGTDQRWQPIDYNHTFTQSAPPFGLGLHMFDWSLAMGDLLYLVDNKASQLAGSENFWVLKY